MSMRKIIRLKYALFLVAFLVIAGVVAIVVRPGKGYTKIGRTKAKVELVALAAAELVKEGKKNTSSVLQIDDLVSNNYFRADSLIDPWGKKLLLKCGDLACKKITIYSSGPNVIDDGAGGDDIVFSINNESEKAPGSN